MQDRAMQALYLLALEPVTETMADGNSYGFRRKRSTADAIDALHRLLSRRVLSEWILEGDIKGVLTISAIVALQITYKSTREYSTNGLKQG